MTKYSKIEDIESRCEIAIYSAERNFVSTILSVGLSSYGICEGFDAIGFVRDGGGVITGVGVVIDMAWSERGRAQDVIFYKIGEKFLDIIDG